MSRRPPVPDEFDSWDSLEGLSGLSYPRTQRPAGPVQTHGQRALSWIGERIPGFVLAATLALLADGAANGIGHTLMGYKNSPVNGIAIAIALGVLLCNTVGIPLVFQEGLRACMRPLQRLAIMLLGWRLSLGAVGGIGLHALPVVIICIAAALVVIPWFGEKVGLSRRLATLIAVGTSICGVSAIMATAPAIDADESEVSYAVACVAIFGMLAMVTYPFAAPLLFGTHLNATGVFFGTAIHDTAQVTGAALSYQQMHAAPDVLNTATVVKIMRNLSMAGVIPLMAGLFLRSRTSGKFAGPSRGQILPLFVVGFLAMTVLRTIGDQGVNAFGFVDRAHWDQFLGLMDRTSTWLLTVVMAAVGLSTGLAGLKRLGWKPFLVGLAAALMVGAVATVSIHLLISG